jgi:hypothetical protein
VWTKFYKELEYKKHICLNQRKGPKTKLDRLRPEEWDDVLEVAVAMCEREGVDVADIINSVNSAAIQVGMNTTYLRT